MTRLLILCSLLLLSACYRPLNDPDSVARQFADALIDGRPTSALIYTAPSYREKEGLLQSFIFDSTLLEKCRGRIFRQELPIDETDKRTYRFFFNEICGSDIQFIGIDVSVARNGDRWQVTSHSPQLLPPRS